jgi:hypothetical protein
MYSKNETPLHIMPSSAQDMNAIQPQSSPNSFSRVVQIFSWQGAVMLVFNTSAAYVSTLFSTAASRTICTVSWDVVLA